MRRHWYRWILFGVVISLGWPPLGSGLAAPPAQERIALIYGQTVTGSIDDTHFFRQYRFTGSAGDPIVITMDAISGNLDPLLLLGDADLNLIAEDDDGGGGFNARLEVVLPADGVYIIEATRYGQDTEAGQSSGEFRLTLVANRAVAGEVTRGGVFAPLDFGDTARGLLTTANPFHLFWFQAQAGDRVSVQSALGVGVSASLFLYDAAFVELAHDPAGREVGADIGQGGIYFVALALNDGAASGTYALALSGSVSGPADGAVALPLVYGQRIEGAVTDGRPSSRYRFEGRTSEQVLIRMEALDGDLDPFLYLYGPNGEIVGQDDDSAGGLDAELAAVLPVDGSYTLVATRFGGENGSSVGAYALSLTLGVSSGDAASAADTSPGYALPEDFVGLPQIRYGDAIGGTIAGDDYFGAYIFEAAAGDEVVITMERVTGDLDPLVRLLNADLETVAEHDDISAGNYNARLTYTIPADGYYAILAMRYQGETGTTSGDYMLTLDATNVVTHSRVATLLPATVMTAGETASGRIGDSMAALFAFYAAADDVVDFSLQTSGLLADEAMLILADADLNEVGVSYDGTLRYTVPEDGRYTVIVSRQRGPLGDARGFFEVSLTGATAALPEEAAGGGEALGPGSLLTYGTVVTETITDAQPAVEYYFLGQAGDRITVRMEALDATLDPMVVILDAEGNQVVSDDDSGGDLNALIASYLLTGDGQYTLVATRYERERGSSRGRFELTLAGVSVTQLTPSPERSGLAAGTAFPLGLGQTVSGTIDDESIAVFYAFQVEAGTAVVIDMVKTAGDLDPFLALLDAGQNLVATDDDSGGNRNARLRFTASSSELYYIVATRFEWFEGTTTGEYLLSLIAR